MPALAPVITTVCAMDVLSGASCSLAGAAFGVSRPPSRSAPLKHRALAEAGQVDGPPVIGPSRGLATALRVAISAVQVPRRPKVVIDRHLISLAIALQHIDDDVPKLQAWGRTAASNLAAGGRFLACGA